MKNNNSSLRVWLGFKCEPDFSKSRPLGLALGGILSVAGLALITMCVVGLSVLFAAFIGLGPYGDDPSGAAIRNVGLVLAAIVGFPFIVWRSAVAQRNATTAEQAQITDRLNKAVQGLGTEKLVKRIIEKQLYQKDEDGWLKDKKGALVPALQPDNAPLIEREQFEETLPNIEVRVGAILSLERIARDSVRDYEHIMGILAIYVRENSTAAGPVNKLREDLQAAMTVITSQELTVEQETRISRHGKYALYKTGPDFSNTNLDYLVARQSNFVGVTLNSASLRNASLGFSDFRGSNCEDGCDFSGADLECCQFMGASLANVLMSTETTLAEVYFERARLENVKFAGMHSGPLDFTRATLINCSFIRLPLYASIFRNANISGTSFLLAGLFEVDFTGVTNWEQGQFDVAFGVRGGKGMTILPEGAMYPDHWTDLTNLDEKFDAFATFEEEYKIWKLDGPDKYRIRMQQILAGMNGFNS